MGRYLFTNYLKEHNIRISNTNGDKMYCIIKRIQVF